jgi:hypothetical protein
MPLGLRLQKSLTLVDGMVETDGVDEIFLACRLTSSDSRALDG